MMLDLGADPKSIEIARKQHGASQDFEVYEENWETLMFFISLDTQWNILGGMSGAFYIGIPAPNIEAEMNLQEIPQEKRKQLRYELKLMEREALTVLNKKDN